MQEATRRSKDISYDYIKIQDATKEDVGISCESRRYWDGNCPNVFYLTDENNVDIGMVEFKVKSNENLKRKGLSDKDLLLMIKARVMLSNKKFSAFYDDDTLVEKIDLLSLILGDHNVEK